MNDKKIHIDQLFGSQLGGAEEAFDPNAWEQMQTKLDSKSKPKAGFIWLPTTKSQKIKTLIIMTTLITSVAIALYMYSPQPETPYTNTTPTVIAPQTSNEIKTPTLQNNTAALSNSTAKNTPAQPAQKKATIKANVSPAAGTIKNYNNNNWFQSRNHTNNILGIKPLSAHTVSYDTKLEENTVEPDSIKIRRIIIGNRKYRYDKPWIGFHLTGMMPLGTLLDSGYRPGIGMNLELMSGDVLKSKYIGVSFGGSIGFLWNGQGHKQDVTLATPNNDKGYTRLYNMGFHGDFIARMEFGNFRLKPYIDGTLGIRNMTTYQSINSYQTIQGYDNTTETIYSSWALQYGMSAGLRWHWMPGVSVDLRGTLYKGGNIGFVDAKHTPYNANMGAFVPRVQTAPSEMFVLRLGLLFDLDELSYESNHRTYNNNSAPRTTTNNNPVYDNSNTGSSGNNSSAPAKTKVQIGNGGTNTPRTPLKIKTPAPAPVKR